MATEDYYQVLNVTRDATAEDIQKAYRKLARKYHPDLQESDDDREQAKQRFQKVQAAYDVLSDPEKRKRYDRFGPNFEQMEGSGPVPGGQFQDVDIDWSQLFGGGSGHPFQDFFTQMQGQRTGNRRGGRAAPPPRSNLDVQEEITVPFNIAVLGGEYRLQLNRDGRTESISVKIPVGIEDGKRIRLKGQGGKGARGERGDLFIRVRIADHPCFQREGSNLRVRVPITIFEAWLGAKVEIPTPHGQVTVTVPPGSSSGKVLRLKGMGIRSSTQSQPGDLFVTLEVVVPEPETNPQREQIEALQRLMPMAAPRRDLRW
ncbi:MAG TPA: J domain-containing protein [Pirellulaceae bacterium]|nr:J domain-containing protein [Pirellulaceae bacterium]